MQCATCGWDHYFNFGMGSPGAATVMDLLTAIGLKRFVLGKMWRLKKTQQDPEDLILP